VKKEEIKMVAAGETRADAAQTPRTRKTLGRRQRIYALALACAILFLALAMVIVSPILKIYRLEDEYLDASGAIQKDRYTLKRDNGVYKMYDRDGNLMETTENSFYSKEDDTWYMVYVAKNSGNQYLINSKTGEYETYAVVDYDGAAGEKLAGNKRAQRVMIFPRIQQEFVYSISVTNEYGSFFVERENTKLDKKVGEKEYGISFKLDRAENSLAECDETALSTLISMCGYTLTMMKLDLSSPDTPRLPDGRVDYSAYGFVCDENGNPISGAGKYTITQANVEANGYATASNVQHTVYVGDRIVSDAGYYVMKEGRNAVYIMDVRLKDSVLAPVESLVSPQIVYPMGTNTYIMVNDFKIGRLAKYTDLTDEQLKDDEFIKQYLKENLDLIAAFDFVDMDYRSNTMFSSDPYWLDEDTSYMNGYTFDSDNITTVLGNLHSMQCISCIKLSPEEEDLKEYGLTKNVTLISYRYDASLNMQGATESTWVENMILIGQKNEKGTYYAYSYLYNMLVEIDPYYVSFTEWSQNRWYSQEIFQSDINYIRKISFSYTDDSGVTSTYDFRLDNRFSYAYYDNGNGTGTLIDFKKGTLSQRSDGVYVFKVNATGQEHVVYLMDFEAGQTYVSKGTGNNGSDQLLYRSPAGVVVVVSQNTNNLQIYTGANGDNLLGYTVNGTSATDNFRNFYVRLLGYSIEGDVSLEDIGGDINEYVRDLTPKATIRIEQEDMASVLNPTHWDTNQKQTLIVRFYEYPSGTGNDRKLLFTIEVLENPNATPNPQKAQGGFFSLTRPLEDLAKYANNVVNGVWVPPTVQ
jgi:hypothetical protein